jgi:hypothetical protein
MITITIITMMAIPLMKRIMVMMRNITMKRAQVKYLTHLAGNPKMDSI